MTLAPGVAPRKGIRQRPARSVDPQSVHWRVDDVVTIARVNIVISARPDYLQEDSPSSH
jgi:hypothetical protein